MAFTPEQIAEVQEKRDISRKGAVQFLARQAKAAQPRFAAKPKAAKPVAEKAARKGKYNVNMDPARVKAAFKEHKTVSATAQALGYPVGHGQNRTRKVLVKAGVYKKREGK